MNQQWRDRCWLDQQPRPEEGEFGQVFLGNWNRIGPREVGVDSFVAGGKLSVEDTNFVSGFETEVGSLDYAAFLSNDFTNPPTCDFTTTSLSFNVSTSSGRLLRTGGRFSRSMCAR